MNDGVTADFGGLTRASKRYDALRARARQIHAELTEAGVFDVKFGTDHAGRDLQPKYDESIIAAMQKLWNIHQGLGSVSDGIDRTKKNLASSDVENADLLR